MSSVVEIKRHLISKMLSQHSVT